MALRTANVDDFERITMGGNVKLNDTVSVVAGDARRRHAFHVGGEQGQRFVLHQGRRGPKRIAAA